MSHTYNLAQLAKRNAKSRGKLPMSDESMNSMLRATHGRFENVQITTKRGKRVMICRGLSVWPKHERLARSRQSDGTDASKSA